MGVYDKLLEIQKATRGFSKDKQGNNYKYVSGDKILGHVRDMMDNLGLLLKQEVTSIENERQDYKTGVNTSYEKPKSEILSKVMMKFTWICVETKETDENLFGANGQNDWDKGVGSALTYAERYFLLKFFHIPTDEDDIDNPDAKTPIPTDEDDKSKVKLPAIGQTQYTQALARINKGEKLLTALKSQFTLSVAQEKVLSSAESNYKPSN